MNKQTIRHWAASLPPVVRHILSFFTLFIAFFLIELLCFCLLQPGIGTGLHFGALWAGFLACIVLFLPRKAGRITFGILYIVCLLWTLAQAGYYQVFNKMMWVSTIAYAGEGAGFLGDVLLGFPLLWWFGLILMLGLGVVLLRHFPHSPVKLRWRALYLPVAAILVLGLCLLPQQILYDDPQDPPAEYEESVPYAEEYKAMNNAETVYKVTGIYHLTARDIWCNEIYPLTPAYKNSLAQQRKAIDNYFAKRGASESNSMTGFFAGKNVVLVLMESMDDWMMTEADTPTICRLMDEGINFTNFYTPGYGSARTLNSEFCMNTGIYLPTTGSYVFDYLENSFDQSIASQLTNAGYSAKVFHYNNPDFYSRGELEPAMGYESYVSYGDYISDRRTLCDDNLVFDIPEVCADFFREGPTFNTIITRSAHLGYTYNEIITSFALRKYPEYKAMYGSEEERCARVKAKLVDDMFARLLEELEARGQLQDTVIIAMTDHYTYGYKNMEELYAHSGVSSDLLLEKTPFFVWSADKPDLEVTKTLNTADFLPTVLNLLGVDSPYSYLGQDAFDPLYPGHALFPDGSWIAAGIAWQDGKVLMNQYGRTVTQEMVDNMAAVSEEYRDISNLLLTCNYYQ